MSQKFDYSDYAFSDRQIGVSSEVYYEEKNRQFGYDLFDKAIDVVAETGASHLVGIAAYLGEFAVRSGSDEWRAEGNKWIVTYLREHGDRYMLDLQTV